MPDPIAGHTAERIPRSGSEQTEQRVEPHPHQNHQHDLGTERQDTPGDESREKKTDITPVGKNCVSEAINSSMPSDSTRYRTDFGSKNKNVSPAPIVFLSAHDSKIFRLVCFMHIRKMVNNELKNKKWYYFPSRRLAVALSLQGWRKAGATVFSPQASRFSPMFPIQANQHFLMRNARFQVFVRYDLESE